MTHSVLPIAPEVEVIEKTFAALKSRVPQQRVLTAKERIARLDALYNDCLLYTSPSPRDYAASRMPSSA